MKILICTGIYPPDIGGPATYSKLLMDELPKRGIGAEVLSFGEVRYLPKIIRHFVYFLKILRVGKTCDIIYAQDPVSVGFPAMLASKILGKKFVLKIVGDYAWEQHQLTHQFITPEDFQNKKFNCIAELRKKIERVVASKANKIIVPSEYLKKIVLMWGTKKEKIEVIYNTFDVPVIFENKEELRKKLNLSGFVLISAGRLVPWKGFDVLIETMPEILKEIPEARLYIVGDGPEQENLKSQISNLKLEDSVFLCGKLPHEKLLEYLKASDVFVLNTGYEGLSHQILEAMAVGVSIITTDVGGNPELIKNKEAGFLVKYNDKEALKTAIIYDYKNEQKPVPPSQFSKEKMLESLINKLNIL